MEDSKIYYLVLGAIWILSKVFGKKKKKAEEAQEYDEDLEYEQENTPQKTAPTSFDEILKELTKEVGIPQEVEEKPEPVIIEQETKPQAPLVATPLKSAAPAPSLYSDYVRPKEANQGSNSEFVRSSNFKIEEEEVNEVALGIHEMLADTDGAQKAIILSEILNRKY